MNTKTAHYKFLFLKRLRCDVTHPEGSPLRASPGWRTSRTWTWWMTQTISQQLTVISSSSRSARQVTEKESIHDCKDYNLNTTEYSLNVVSRLIMRKFCLITGSPSGHCQLQLRGREHGQQESESPSQAGDCGWVLFLSFISFCCVDGFICNCRRYWTRKPLQT